MSAHPDDTGGAARLGPSAAAAGHSAASAGHSAASVGRVTALPADPIVRRFVRGSRLISIPARQSKRRLVLDWLAQDFEPGKVYPEAAVNAILGRHHPDFAALRRYLVDEGFMERRGGFYWRAGGTYVVG